MGVNIMLFARSFRTCFAIAVLIGVENTFGLSVGQKDTFSDGTTQNWSIQVFAGGGPLGSPPAEAYPANISTGGPAGANDNYLQLTSLGGLGPGSRLSVFNFNNQWAGNYLDAGVEGIRFDVNNFGQNDLALRLYFGDPGAGPPQNVAISLNSILVPAGSGWQSITFPIASTDLLALQGTTFNALSAATELRLFHSPDANFPGPAMTARVGVDNIEALGTAQVPDSGSATLLFACGLVCLAYLRRSP